MCVTGKEYRALRFVAPSPSSFFTERSLEKRDAFNGPLQTATARGLVERISAESAQIKTLNALLKLGLSMGKDTKACPCQTIVPLYRNHVFAQIKPTTQTRIDFGLALGDTKKTPKRLIDTGGFAKKDRITHRFEITSLKDIDDEVKRWLKVAYDRDE